MVAKEKKVSPNYLKLIKKHFLLTLLKKLLEVSTNFSNNYFKKNFKLENIFFSLFYSNMFLYKGGK